MIPNRATILGRRTGRAYDAETVTNLYTITGIRGGVVVHLGVEDGQQIAA